MKSNFSISIKEFKDIKEIPNDRTINDYKELLNLMDFTDTQQMSDDEVLEMCLMSLQDLGATDAAKLILKYDFKDKLKDGQINNIANEMLDEKLWEEYADTSMHEKFFSTATLLYKAFPSEFPKPDAVSVNIDITPLNEEAKHQLQEEISESFVLRLLIGALDEHSILKRLYGDQIKAQNFAEAQSLIWIINTLSNTDERAQLNIISSGYWLDSIARLNDFEATLTHS